MRRSVPAWAESEAYESSPRHAHLALPFSLLTSCQQPYHLAILAFVRPTVHFCRADNGNSGAALLEIGFAATQRSPPGPRQYMRP